MTASIRFTRSSTSKTPTSREAREDGTSRLRRASMPNARAGDCPKRGTAPAISAGRSREPEPRADRPEHVRRFELVRSEAEDGRDRRPVRPAQIEAAAAGPDAEAAAAIGRERDAREARSPHAVEEPRPAAVAEELPRGN